MLSFQHWANTQTNPLFQTSWLTWPCRASRTVCATSAAAPASAARPRTKLSSHPPPASCPAVVAAAVAVVHCPLSRGSNVVPPPPSPAALRLASRRRRQHDWSNPRAVLRAKIPCPNHHHHHRRVLRQPWGRLPAVAAVTEEVINSNSSLI